MGAHHFAAGHSGGRDLPYVEALSKPYQLPLAQGSAADTDSDANANANAKTLTATATVTANERIAAYVRGHGGALLGICAGAYYTSAACAFEAHDPAYRVVGARPPELSFFPGTCAGTAYPGFVYESDAGARIVRVALEEADEEGEKGEAAGWYVHYNGGGAFMHAERYADSVEVVARYDAADPHLANPTPTPQPLSSLSSSSPSSSSASASASASPYASQAAAVLCKAGKGRALLFGVHPEISLAPRSSAIRSLRAVAAAAESKAGAEAGAGVVEHTDEQLAHIEHRRLLVLGRLLRRLGLEVKLPTAPAVLTQTAMDDEEHSTQRDLAQMQLDQRMARAALAESHEQPTRPEAPLPPSITEPPRLSPLILAEGCSGGTGNGSVPQILGALRTLVRAPPAAGSFARLPFLSAAAPKRKRGADARPGAQAQAQEQERAREGEWEGEREREREDRIRAARLFSFADSNDCFHLFDAAAAPAAAQHVEADVARLCREASYATYRSDEAAKVGASASGSGSGEQAEATQEEEEEEEDKGPEEDPLDLDLNKVPKLILAYPSGRLPAPHTAASAAESVTPYFDAHAFVASLEASRARLEHRPILVPGGGTGGGGAGFGGRPSWHEKVVFANAFLYGQVVTSTQTMLDK